MEAKQELKKKEGFYLITSAQDLLTLSESPQLWNENFLQTADIDMRRCTTYSPIGNIENTFTGTYDGQGYSIYNLTMNCLEKSYVALFGINNGGKLKNIRIKSGHICGRNLTAGICGDVAGKGEIIGCYNGADITAEIDVAGGIAGCTVADALVSDCVNTGTITAKETVGGIVGYSSNNSIICKSCNMGKINANTSIDVDEICGKQGGKVIDCKSEHSILTFDDVDFKKYLVDNFDKDGDGEISIGEAMQVENIDFELWAPQRGNVKSVKGIENFKFLKKLNCSNHHISELDLSENTELEDLWCHDNDLKSLELSNNKKLKYLRCWSNQITMLNVSENLKLDVLYCNNMPSLTKVFIAKEQSIRDVIKDAHTELIEKGKEVCAKLGDEVCSTHLQRYYKTAVVFEEAGKRYLFHHSSADNRWYMTELTPNWNLQSEIENGNWMRYYSNIVKFEYKGKPYLFAHSQEDNRWFISELSASWDGQCEIGSGYLDEFYGNVFVFEKDDKVYLCGHSEMDKKFFMREILIDNI